MVKKYILENEVKKHYATTEANDYLINGKSSKVSEIEEIVRNGTIVITEKQTKTLLNYIVALPLEKAYEEIAKTLEIDYKDSTKVVRALDRNKLVNYRKSEKKCTLTRKGKALNNGKSNKK